MYKQKILLDIVKEALVRGYKLYISIPNGYKETSSILIKKTSSEEITAYFKLELEEYLESYSNILSILRKDNTICEISFEKEKELYQAKIYEVNTTKVDKEKDNSIDEISIYEETPDYALNTLNIIIRDNLEYQNEIQNKYIRKKSRNNNKKRRAK